VRVSKLASGGAINAGALIGNVIILFCKILNPKRHYLPSLSTIGDGEGPGVRRAGGEARISKLASGGAINAGALIGNVIILFCKILNPKRHYLPSLSTIGDGEGPGVRFVSRKDSEEAKAQKSRY